MEKINATKSPNCIEIRGEYHPIKDLVLDKFGYLLIRPNKELNLIELGFCKKDNVIVIVISGKTPQDIYKIVCVKNLLAKIDLSLIHLFLMIKFMLQQILNTMIVKNLRFILLR